MKIRCKCCSHTEETSKDFFVKIIGGALPVGGDWAWVTYFFAGTGFAMPIVVAMILGGVGLLAFQHQVIQFIADKAYKCPKCSECQWEAIG